MTSGYRITADAPLRARYAAAWKQGARLRYQGWELEITRMDRRRIDEVRAVKLLLPHSDSRKKKK